MADDPDPKLSILMSIKKMLGIDPSDTAFDTDVIIHINSVLATLWQLGVGLEDSQIEVEDNTTLWTDLLTTQQNLTYVKTYVYLKVRIVFDPLATGFVTTSFENQIKELEWRIVVATSSYPNVPATAGVTAGGGDTVVDNGDGTFTIDA